MPSFLEAPVSGAYHLLTSLVSALQPLAGPYAAVAAIVVCTLFVRLCLLPLSLRAHRGLKARAVMMPQLKTLTERHRDNPERLQKELAKLQSESGTSLFAGFLPTLAQLPFFWLMYTLFSRAIVGGEANQLISGTLFGAPLGLHWPVFAATPGFGVLAVLLAVVAYFSARVALRQLDAAATPLTRRLARLLPYGTVLTAAFVPLAAGLYLVTTTTWTVVERAILQR
ncbi:membrane protein insertase YidC [Kribbella sandramycini]|uniref:Membrane protein insertase YidC n=1 Tax=Kribbella sandramycini TaxID=60450 RepID=A0A7Y4KZL8_9ACTN|nr:membrane protein insertase YidC [Kribbella sandramycini]MBB6569381.1 YidC/Oxa1 family membrane protein insertase [Kribbella sandramycini]NOL40781.1 membrane protein insertase YidC [Kribbella sandramycini]